MPPLYDSTSTYDDLSLSFDGFGAPLANMPAVGVFIAWTDTPYTVSPVWTEISQYVRQISIRRGRQDDLQQFPPGTASLVLDNRERLFDPFNTSGANYANLKPRKQIKIVANWAGVEYPLYRGYISGWPVEYTDAGLDSTVTIECFDLLALLANETLPTDWPDYYVRQNNAIRFFRCNDSRGTTVIRDQIANALTLSRYNSTPALPFFAETPSIAEGISGTAAAIDYYTGTSVGASTPSALSVTAWVKVNRGSIIDALNIAYDKAERGIVIAVEANGAIVVVSRNTGTARRLDAQLQFDPTLIPFHVAAYATDTGVGLWVNGVSIAGTVSTTTTVMTTDETLNLTGGVFSDIAFYATQLSSSQVELIYGAGAARVLETTTVRIERLLSTTLLPTGMRSLTASPQASVSELDSRYQPLPGMQIVAISEGGELFADDQGILTFVPRSYWASMSRSNTSQMTFTDIGTGVGYDANQITISLNADQTRNDINIEFTGDGVVDARDATSVSTYGAAKDTVKTVLDSPVSAQTLADYRLSIYKNPKMQIEPFMAKGQANPSYNWPRLLGLELLDRVTFKRTPTVGSAVQRDLLVQSIEHRITPGEWQTVVNGSTRYTGWFILGVSLLGSTEDVLL